MSVVFNRRHLTDWLVCLGAGMLFCFLTMQHITLPGPNNDEVFTAAPAVNFYHNTYTSEASQIDPSVVSIFGRRIPLMVMTYVGSVETFLYVPVFALFGDGIEVIRILPILVAVIGLWFTYFFFLSAFGRNAAILTLILTLADPGFIFFTGRDFGPPAIALLCKMGGFYFLLRWWRSARTWDVVLAAFIWGLGLYHKADFLWIIAATVIAGLILYRKELLQRFTLRAGLSATAAFCIGSAPFLAMNVLTMGATFSLLKQGKPLGEQIAAYIEGLGTRFVQMADMMNGTASFRLFMGEAPALSPLQSQFLPLFVLAGFFILAGMAVGEGDRRLKRKQLFFVLVTCLVFLQTAKSPTALMEHHMMAMYPLLQGVSAAGWVLVMRRFDQGLKRVGIACILLGGTGALAVGITTTQQTYRALERTGGRGYWSDAIYELSEYLEQQRKPVASMEWGFTANLVVLAEGHLRVKRVYKEFMDHGYTSDVVVPYINEKTLYLFHTPGFKFFAPAFEALDAAAAAEGLVPVQQRIFHQRDGRPVYTIFTLQRP